MAPTGPSDEAAGGGRRREIATAAARLFYEEGYDAVGMRAVARAVGIQGASLYHHFSSKAMLLDDIVADVSTNFIETRLPDLLAGHGPVPDRLRALLRDHIAYFWEHRVELAVGLRELNRLPPDRARTVQAARRRYQRALADVIARGVADGTLVTDDPFLAATATLAVVNGINDWFDPAGRLTLHKVAAATADMVVDDLLGAGRAGS